MSAYINLETKEYPLHEGDIRLLYPEMGEEFILPEGYALVHPVEIPELEKLQYYEQTDPIEIDGKWMMQIVIKERTQEKYDELMKILAPQKYMLDNASGTEPNVIG